MTCAYVQVKRIAQARGVTEERVKQLIGEVAEAPLLGVLGPQKVNVLKLNVALDKIK